MMNHERESLNNLNVITHARASVLHCLSISLSKCSEGITIFIKGQSAVTVDFWSLGFDLKSGTAKAKLEES